MSLKRPFKNELQNILASNRCFTHATLAEHGSNHENISTGALTYMIDGLMYTKAAQTELDLSGLDGISDQGGNTDCLYLLAIDASGAFSIVKGTDHAVGSEDAKRIPKIPENVCVVGAVHLSNEQAASAAFTLGTTALNETGVTATYYNLSYAFEDAALS